MCSRDQDEAMQPYGLFEVLGIELEYMLVDLAGRSIRSDVATILQKDGKTVDELHFDGTAWSNELVSHVLEIKSEPPAKTVADAYPFFRRDLEGLIKDLNQRGYTLMGTGMHPFMNPREMKLWPGENGPIYQTFHRIFDCTGHGWSNLQSMHLNYPFKNDEEFGRLMAAIRVLLPLLPALSASSPICENKWTGFADYRLEVYRNNAARIPSISGDVIPEPVFEMERYQEEVLGRIYEDLEPYDAEGILREEWVNARGAIARFDRNAIEIRILDTQESLCMDMAIALVVTETLRALVEERWCSYESQRKCSQEILIHHFNQSIRYSGKADLEGSYSALFGGLKKGSMHSLWQNICEELYFSSHHGLDNSVEFLLARGSFSRRIKSFLEKQSGYPLMDIPVNLGPEVLKLYSGMTSPLMEPFDA